LRATPWLQRFFSPAKQEKIEALFKKHGATGLFIGRFLPGLRAPIFFSAGSMRVDYVKFLLFDGFAALISVPVFVWLGHWLWTIFRDDIEHINRVMALTRTYAHWIVVLGVLIGGAVWWRTAQRKLTPLKQ
jgi:membrane protein DedA with SNARE-associated domain